MAEWPSCGWTYADLTFRYRDQSEHRLLLGPLGPKYCNKSNHEIFKEYVDIISGKETSRPAYDSMFIDAHKKLFDLLLFWDLSRFSRAGTLFTLQKLKELENLGIDWESYWVSQQGDGPLKHNGGEPGWLYIIDEAVGPEDMYPHPETVMGTESVWPEIRISLPVRFNVETRFFKSV